MFKYPRCNGVAIKEKEYDEGLRLERNLARYSFLVWLKFRHDYIMCVTSHV